MARFSFTLNRALCIARRWLDLVLYALPASAIYAYAPDLASPLLQKILHSLPNLPGLVGIGLCFGIGLLAVCFLHSAVRSNLGHVRSLLTYPPLPLIVFVSILASPLWLTSPPTTHPIPAHLAAGAYFLLWLIQAAFQKLWTLLERLSLSGNGPSPAGAPKSLRDFSDDELVSWLRKEVPITQPHQDLFDAMPVARRILQRLSGGDNTIALQGPFGAGKSSVLQLVARLAHEQFTPCRFLFVSCWGFDESARAQEALLQELVTFANERVDCFHVRRIPQDYVSAVCGTTSWLPILGPFLNRPGSPVAQLRRLSPILAAAGSRIVLVLEDVDRNGSQFDLAHIQALLTQFRDVPGLSFILAISLGQHIDFARFTDFQEQLPDVPVEIVSNLVQRVRDIALRRYDTTPVDPPEPLGAADDRYSIHDLVGSDRAHWPTALVRLLSTPRALKTVLRRTLHTWDELNGEVSIDDLLTTSTLRTVAPAAFSFLSDYFDRLYATIRDNYGFSPTPQERDERFKMFHEAWAPVAAALTVDRGSVEALLAHLLPGSSVVFGARCYPQKKLQGLVSKLGHVYWPRLYREAIDSSEPRDQTVLALMRAAETSHEARISLAASLVKSHAFCRSFEHFARRFDKIDLWDILSQIYAILRDLFGRHFDRESAPGFFSPWRLLIDRPRPPEFSQWLDRELTLCIPKHLMFLTQIYYYWLGTEKFRAPDREPFRRRILEECKKSFEHLESRQFCDGFNPTFPYTLFHLVFTSDYEKPEEVPYGSASDWVWLGPILLNAARAIPNEILPQILIACNRVEGRGGDIPRFAFDETTMTAWFPESRTELLQIITRNFQIDPALNPHAQAILRLAIEAAQSEMQKTPLP